MRILQSGQEHTLIVEGIVNKSTQKYTFIISISITTVCPQTFLLKHKGS